MAGMIVLGVVLLVIVAVFAVAVVVSNPDIVDLYLFNALVPVTMGGVFFTGAGALLIVLVSGLLIQRGIARSARLRRQQRALAGAPSVVPADSLPGTASPTTSPAAGGVPTPPRAHGSHAVEPASSELTPVTPQVTPPSAPVTTVSGEPAALLAEADELTRDEPLR